MTKNDPSNGIKNIFKIFNFTTKNHEIYLEAFSHKSSLNENKNLNRNYERLEWLGDSIIQYYVSKYIYKKFPNISSGDLTLIRWHIVSSKALAEFSRKLNLIEFAKFGKSIGIKKDKLFADIFESFVGALYLDNQDIVLDTIFKFTLFEKINKLEKDFTVLKNPKTLFQEKFQVGNKKLIEYKIINTYGPDHSKIFVCHLICNNILMGIGEGKTKQLAEIMAAKNALSKNVE